jgi:hypothetical protein
LTAGSDWLLRDAIATAYTTTVQYVFRPPASHAPVYCMQRAKAGTDALQTAPSSQPIVSPGNLETGVATEAPLSSHPSGVPLAESTGALAAYEPPATADATTKPPAPSDAADTEAPAIGLGSSPSRAPLMAVAAEPEPRQLLTRHGSGSGGHGTSSPRASTSHPRTAASLDTSLSTLSSTGSYTEGYAARQSARLQHTGRL